MAVLVIVAHPDQKSFCHAIAGTAVASLRAQGCQVISHDLYVERFDPVLPASEIPKGAVLDPVIERHCAELAAADGIIIIHPNWWGQPPAILKGWVDRVVRPDVAYEFLDGDNGEGVPVGLLKARCALIFNTSNTLRERELAVFGDPLETLWKNCVFGLCGVPNFHREMYGVIVTSTPEQRRGWLKDVADITGEFMLDQIGQRLE